MGAGLESAPGRRTPHQLDCTPQLRLERGLPPGPAHLCRPHPATGESRKGAGRESMGMGEQGEAATLTAAPSSRSAPGGQALIPGIN